MVKWCNDNDFFIATYFHNPCSVVYFSLISSSHIKRKIINGNNVTWTTTFMAHLNTFLRFFLKKEKKKMKVCLFLIGAAKRESGYDTRWKSSCSAITGACAKWTVLMKRPENNFRLWGRRKFNLLIAKLGAYGFDTQTLYYIESYLDNRKQRVRVNSNFSSWKEIIAGVLQGSILGLLLFNIIVSDLSLLSLVPI